MLGLGRRRCVVMRPMMSARHRARLTEHHGVSYAPGSAPDPLRSFDLYVPVPSAASPSQPQPQPQPQPPPLICFVHGGAWRSEDKADHAPLARSLALATRFPVAVPNYRLTTPDSPLRHPAHAHDALAFLTFLLHWPGPHPAPRPPYDPHRLYLLAHSCSAHMLSSIFLAPPTPTPTPDPDPDRALVPEPRLLASTRALVFSEGIFDLDLLLRSFPAYNSWFVAAAFGRRPHYAPFNVAAYALRPGADHIRWLLLHSLGDSLVDRPQTETMYAHLSALLSAEAGRALPPVHRNWDELTEEHNDLLRGDLYPRIVAQFVLDDVDSRG